MANNKMEAFIYALGVVSVPLAKSEVNMVNLDSIDKNIREGYSLSKVHSINGNNTITGDRVSLYGGIDKNEQIITIHTEQFTIHHAAAILMAAYEMHAKEHSK